VFSPAFGLLDIGVDSIEGGVSCEVDQSLGDRIIDHCQKLVELSLRPEFDETLGDHLGPFLGFGATGRDLVDQVWIRVVVQQLLRVLESVLVEELTQPGWFHHRVVNVAMCPAYVDGLR
jgi:hypothetical protein